MSSCLPANPSRDAARKAFGVTPVLAIEILGDFCQNSYGVAPCTASGAPGTECYNTFPTCQDIPNYGRTTKTYRFISQGSTIPPGENWRPYIVSFKGAVTKLDLEKGLARRSKLTIVLKDEPDSDIGIDPYLSTRTPPSGTFWRRYLARNRNYVGRFVKVRRGYAVDPWDWNTFVDQLYIIDKIDGPVDGQVTLTLKDPTKLLDYAKVPIPTSGKLEEDLKAYEHQDFARAGGLNTITLADGASPVDDAYKDMEIYISANKGSGQRRKVLSYTGATRQATLDSNWSVIPNTTSYYQVSRLSVSITVGKGPDYDRYGSDIYIRIGKELIRCTRTGDTFSWPDSTYRAQRNTERKDHKTGDSVQLCLNFESMLFTDVIKKIANEAGLSDAYINTAGLTSEDNDYLAETARITHTLHTPERATALVNELASLSGAAIWWCPMGQHLEYKVVAPHFGGVPLWQGEYTFKDEPEVERLEELRITRAVMAYDLETGTSNRKQDDNYLVVESSVDADAESANDYGDERPQVALSRWFGRQNAQFVSSMLHRRRVYYRDAPLQIRGEITPKDFEVPAGGFVDVKDDKITDETGAAKTVRVMVTKIDDRGGTIGIEARSTVFGKRFAFWAPAGAGDYPNDIDYAHWSDANGLMSDGTEGYLYV